MSSDAGRGDGARVGSSVVRREDGPLLTGEAEFTDDLSAPRMVHMAVLRSQYAHARIDGIDATAAEETDGVHEVFARADLVASGVPGIVPPRTSIPGPDGPDSTYRIDRPMPDRDRSLLAGDVVRYVGEPIAVVVASDRYAARDGVAAIDVDYDRRDAIVDPIEAVEGDAPAVHGDRPDNVAFEWEAGDPAGTDAAFESAPNTASVEIAHQRVLSNPMEPRATLADYSRSTGELSVFRPGQGPHAQRDLLSRSLGVSPGRIRVRSPATGGSFGSKSQPYPAELLAAWCSMQVGRPVKWQATRSEMHVSSAHGRGHATRAEIAFSDEGDILGLRATTFGDVGAYVFGSTPIIHTRSFASGLSGQYDIPAIHCRVIGAYTTTTPVSAYRGTGRPRANLVVERLVDLAAGELGVDPVDLRRRNFIPPDGFPHRTPIGMTYDSGDYERTLDRALEMLDYDARRKEQAALRDGGGTDGESDAGAGSGRSLGIGLSCSVDQIGSPTDSARVVVHPSGEVTAYCGTFDTGQGHYTTFAQLLADELSVPFEDVRIREGDSDDLAIGGGTGGSRSAINAGEVLTGAAERVIDEGRQVAAHHLEAAPADVEFAAGSFAVAGAPERALGFAEVAELAYGGDLPDGLEPGLEATATGAAPETFSAATHVALVEVDAETGEVALRRYVAVEDCGTQINPTVVEGQIHGATAAGIGQGLTEGAVYDDAGTLLTGSFQDYAMPKANGLPELEVDTVETPSPDTVRGIKGIGENGTNAAPAAIANAVADALAPFGVSHVDLPVTDEAAWRAMQG